jgi:O-antigen ligase
LILAAHSGHVSRLPQLIAIFAVITFTFWAGLWRALSQVRGLQVAVFSVVAALVVLVAVLGASRLGDIGSRWNQLEWKGLRGGSAPLATPPESEWPKLMRDDLFVASDHRAYPLGDRGAAYATAGAAIADRPWFGWGPGSGWTAASAAHSADPFLRTFYLLIQFTHSDVLQTCVEWGVVGAAGWALLVPGALVHALARIGFRPSRDFIGAGAVTALIAVLIQSLTDFPLQIPAIQLNAVALAALAWSVPAPGGTYPPFSSSLSFT